MTLLVRGRPVSCAFPPFRARWPWIGGDLQTIRNTLVWRAPLLPAAEPLSLPVSGGDALVGLLHRAQGRKPLIVLVHGLTGDAGSANVLTSAAFHHARGHAVLRLNLRGAGPSLASSHAHYHAGRSADLHEALAGLAPELAINGVAVIGVSLGGNVVLKFAAETKNPAITAAVGVCAPIDLKMAQARIMSPRNRLYHHHLLRSMRANARAGGGRSRELVIANAARIRTIYDFDDLVVAPANGFTGAEDYYRRSSAGPLLADVRIPTLALHAADDPWVPAAMYLDRAWPDAGATFLLCPGGGHVGFHDAASTAPWHDRAIGAFIDSLADEHMPV